MKKFGLFIQMLFLLDQAEKILTDQKRDFAGINSSLPVLWKYVCSWIFCLLPLSDGLDGFLHVPVMLPLHGPVHVRQLHLPAEVHVHGGPLHGGIGEILHRVAQLEKGLKRN